MKCLILAAGYATRLYPLTENFPKPLLKVGEKTILDWLVDDIVTAGVPASVVEDDVPAVGPLSPVECDVVSSWAVDEFVVISNHKFAHFFEEWATAKSQETGRKFTVVDDGTSTNDTRLGAVRDIQFAVDTLGLDDDLLVIAGDNMLDFCLSSFLDYALSKGTSCIMRYYEPDEARLRKCGIVVVDDNDRILDMAEKPADPKSHWCCPPFYFYTREDARRIAEGIAAGCGVDAPGSFAAWLSSRTAVHAMEMPGRRFDIGNLDSYRRVCEEFS
ncbi:MAG: sugar phosphate nucleotidyltransferase [Bacteroidia bacterium]|nr:sugar phosphate nucleotidyltransferase [Bacteroidia bacterium]